MRKTPFGTGLFSELLTHWMFSARVDYRLGVSPVMRFL